MKKLKHIKSYNHLKGGRSDNKTLEDVLKHHTSKGVKLTLSELKKQFDIGIKVESEHTTDRSIQMEIALDHLTESPTYYTDLKNMEKKEEKKNK